MLHTGCWSRKALLVYFLSVHHSGAKRGQEDLNLRGAILKKSMIIRVFEVQVHSPVLFFYFTAELKLNKSTPVFWGILGCFGQKKGLRGG